MARHEATLVEESLWIDATAGAPCPCCGAEAACSVLDDGEFVRCFGIASRWPVAEGGWLHRVSELTAPTQR